jgi:hypothetical protein
MKKIFFLIGFLCSIAINAQSLGYNDLGVLFSEDESNGTARYRGMSGAFGALGGDLSSMDINPAGAAVFLKSELSFSLNFRNQNISSDYYNTLNSVEEDFTSLSQAGAVFVFKNSNSRWNNTAISFNYSISRDFDNNWAANGNSDFPTFIYDDDYTDDGDSTNDILYLNSDGQNFRNFTNGTNDKFTFSVASQYDDNLYIGAAITFQDISFYQAVTLQENNNDGNGNSIQGNLFEELFVVGNGISFNLGVISKASDNLRLGLSYKSPTWYEMNEEFRDENGVNGLDYSLRAPSKLTGSVAYVFNKNGLISLDYSTRNYNNINISSNVDFSDVNQGFNTDLKNASELRFGAEIRSKEFSFRGGYHYQKSPYKNALSSDHLKGYSLGLGYNFGNIKFDLSYEDANRTDVYDFYPQYPEINPTELKFDTSKITVSLVFNI